MTINQYINDAGIQQVEKAIADAEEKTICEIVPVIMDRADGYYYAGHIFAFIFSLLALIIFWLVYPPFIAKNHFWSDTYQLEYLVLLILSSVVAYIIALFIAEKFPLIKLLFLPHQDMRDRVMTKTLEAFHLLQVGKTQNNTGIILMVSLYEHVVHVRGDINVRQYFNQSDWDKVKDTVIAGIKKDNLAEGMSNGITMLGEVVKNKLPKQSEGKSELSNNLHLLYFNK